MKKVIAVVVVTLIGIGIVATIRGYRPGNVNVLGSVQSGQARPAQAELTGEEAEHVGFGAGAGEQPAQAEPAAPQAAPVTWFKPAQDVADMVKQPFDAIAGSGPGQKARTIAQNKLPLTERFVHGGFSGQDVIDWLIFFGVYAFVALVLIIFGLWFGRKIWNRTGGKLFGWIGERTIGPLSESVGGNPVAFIIRLAGGVLMGLAIWNIWHSPLYGLPVATLVATALLFLAFIWPRVASLLDACVELLNRINLGLVGTFVNIVSMGTVLLSGAIVAIGGIHSAFSGQTLDVRIFQEPHIVAFAQILQTITLGFNWMLVLALFGAHLLVLGPLLAETFESSPSLRVSRESAVRSERQEWEEE